LTVVLILTRFLCPIAADMLKDLGLAARAEGAEALSTTNVFRLYTPGAASVCLVYLDGSGPVHMQCSVRRIRRSCPRRFSCPAGSIGPDAESLQEGAKADLAAATFGEVVKLCINATKRQS
jgi:hypothetical protein